MPLRNFGFFNCWAVHLAPGLMTADGVHLDHGGKKILTLELTGLIGL